MLYRIRHVTRYGFTMPVFLEPHVLRLRPRCDSFQELQQFRLHVSPEPAGISEGNDAAGNQAAVVWFDGVVPELEIVAESTVRTLRPNPFDYLITYPQAARVPAVYPPSEAADLKSCLEGPEDPGVKDLAVALAGKAEGDTMAFLGELSGHLYGEWDVVVRDEGEPLSPSQTLETGKASCRDLAVLFQAVCRSVGVACRFVGGYREGDPGQEKRYMHAWAEVYLPGAGWRGYDPTHGLVVSDRHVVLAAAPHHLGAAPTQGSFRGTGAVSSMEVDLTIEGTRDG